MPQNSDAEISFYTVSVDREDADELGLDGAEATMSALDGDRNACRIDYDLIERNLSGNA